MSAAIGPGSAVICVNVGWIRSQHTGKLRTAPHLRVGAVYFVSSVTRYGGFVLAGFKYPLTSNGVMTKGHNRLRFRPYTGPEQAKRLTCEPAPTDRQGVPA